ncbi:MAG: hypothetical protein NC319_09365 [Butyricicoccus sp.]|nr:hypothetical protein [Butyricicoccus sp.]MCM1372945.1 hypothetical protein [Bacteroides sp.]MCM1448289.1 hypothetical protein [Bacteroides sp.]
MATFTITSPAFGDLRASGTGDRSEFMLTDICEAADLSYEHTLKLLDVGEEVTVHAVMGEDDRPRQELFVTLAGLSRIFDSYPRNVKYGELYDWIFEQDPEDWAYLETADLVNKREQFRFMERSRDAALRFIRAAGLREAFEIWQEATRHIVLPPLEDIVTEEE